MVIEVEYCGGPGELSSRIVILLRNRSDPGRVSRVTFENGTLEQTDNRFARAVFVENGAATVDVAARFLTRMVEG